jgi:hypothetical protein
LDCVSLRGPQAIKLIEIGGARSIQPLYRTASTAKL